MTITYFVPDPLKTGGSYHTVSEAVRKVDSVEQKLILERKTGTAGMYASIKIGDILELHGDFEKSEL